MKFSEGPHGGRLVPLPVDSRLLADNPLGDPALREHPVYLPPGYEESDQAYPVIYYLAAYTNSGAAVGNWRGFGESLVERLDRLIESGQMGPAVVVAPDCFTRLGGNQYVDSIGVGQYASFLLHELVPAVEARFRVKSGPASRALMGKSSGGFGALHLAMAQPGQWGAVACQSGDCHFDWVYRADFPKAAGVLAKYESPDHFVEAFWDKHAPAGSDFATLMVCCLAASYDPDPEEPQKIRLPFCSRTLELDADRWAAWLAFDPIRRVSEAAPALKSLKGLYLDCGNRDQYHIHFGSRLLSERLKDAGVHHHYEEFDGTHSGIDWRLDESLPYIYRAIA